MSTSTSTSLFAGGNQWKKDTTIRYCPKCGAGNTLRDTVWVSVVGVSLCCRCHSSFTFLPTPLLRPIEIANAINQQLDSIGDPDEA